MFESASKFYLPDFFNFYHLNMLTVNMLKENSQWFRPSIKIGSVYGTFPSAIWNGGRTMFGFADIQNVENTIEGFNTLGIPVRFTWTNCKLTQAHVHDTYCNNIMQVAQMVGERNHVINEILVTSPYLEDYLREKYPDFKYISSTTKCLDAAAFEEEIAQNKYYLAVLDYHLNMDKKFLKKLAEGSYPRKVEILLNAYCSEKCPSARRAAHYEQLSWCQLNWANPNPFCEDLAQSFYECKKHKTTFSANQVYNSLIPMGFRHFKIEGRTNHIVDVMESYVYYLGKPQFQELLRNNYLKSML